MADRFWVGGTGSWDGADTTHWSATTGGASGASVPTSADNVTFDTLSNATAYTVTITAISACANLTVGAPLVGDMTLAGTSALSVYGNLLLYATLVRTYTGALTFAATATGKTITFAGVTMASNTTFNGVGGGWTLQDTWNNDSATVTLTNGALDTNGQTVTSGTMNYSNSNTRSLTLGATTWNVNGDWTGTTVTLLTFSGASSTINVSGAARTVSFGSKTLGTVVCTCSGTSSFFGMNTFTTLTFTGSAAKTDIWSFAAGQTVTGTLTINGQSATNRLLMRTGTIGSPITLTAATVSATNADFRDITGAGAGSWDLSAITGGSGNCGGCTGLTFTTPANQYWFKNTGSSSTTANWFLGTGGTGGAGRVPLPQDTAKFDASSFDGASQVFTQDMPRMGSIDFTGATNTPEFTTSTAASLFGSLTLISAMTLTGSTEAYVFEGRGANTFTNAGKTWLKSLTVSAFGGTLTLQGALSMDSSSVLTLNNGTLNANNFNVTCGLFSSSNALVRTLTMGSGTWELTGVGNVWLMTTTTNMTFNANTSTIKMTNTTATARTFAGGSKTFYNVWNAIGAGTATLNITGANTYTDLRDNGSAAHSILFTAATTSTFTSWTGFIGNLVTIGSITAASHTLTKSGGGVIDVQLAAVSRSTATPGSTWYAGPTATDGGNNSGWIFTDAPRRTRMMMMGVGT